MADLRIDIPDRQPQAYPSGFFLCRHCGQYVDPTPAEIERAENAFLPSLARIKCPHCHRRAVQWHAPSAQRSDPQLMRVSDETAANYFRLMHEIVDAA